MIPHQNLGSRFNAGGAVALIAADAASLLLTLPWCARLWNWFAKVCTPAPGLFRKLPKAKNPGMNAGAHDCHSVHPAATISPD